MSLTRVRHIMIVLGVLTILLGALDMLSRLPASLGDKSVLWTAFAPAALLP